MEGRKARLTRIFAVTALACATTALGFGILYDPNTRTYLQLREGATATTQKAPRAPDQSKMTLEPLRTPDERARREMARREWEGVRPAGPGFPYLDAEYGSRNDRRVDEIEARQKALLLLLLLATRSATSAQL